MIREAVKLFPRAVPAAPAPVRARVRSLARAGTLVGALVGTLASSLGGALVAPAHAATGDAALLAAAKLCCDDPSRFAYAPLPAEGSVDFTIDRRSPAFEFQSGRSFFQAFRLPAQTRPYVVELRSFLEGRPSPRDARVFYPVVAILTDDFLVSRATDLDALRFDLPALEQTTAPAYRVQLPLDPAASRERYLVVFTPAPLLEPRAVDASTPDAAEQASRTAYLGASAFGRLRVTVRPATLGATPDATLTPAPQAPGAPATSPTVPPSDPPMR